MRKLSAVCLALLLWGAACSDDSALPPPDGAAADLGGVDVSGAGDLGKPADSGPQGDGGPATGPLTCTGYTTPSFSKACIESTDCVLVLHQSDCCGNSVALGIAASDKALFDAEEAKCSATYPGCGCPSQPPVAEDGSRAPGFDQGSLAVACIAGRCTSFVGACGTPCTDGRTCQTCQSSGAISYAAVCSTSCTSDTDCTDASLPSCGPGSFGAKFCQAMGAPCSP